MNRLFAFIAVVLLCSLPYFGMGQTGNNSSEGTSEMEDNNRDLFEGQTHLLAVKPWLYSVDGELQLGFGGGPIGAMVQTDRIWRARGKLSLFSALSLSSFGGSESYDNAPVTITGRSTDSHLRFHTGGRFTFLRNKNNSSKHAYLRLDLYAGLIYFRTKGNYTNTDLGVDRPYVENELTADWGTRFALGYFFSHHWAVQLSITNSWRQSAFGLGIPSGLLAGEVDGKASLGIGLKYALPWR